MSRSRSLRLLAIAGSIVLTLAACTGDGAAESDAAPANGQAGSDAPAASEGAGDPGGETVEVAMVGGEFGRAQLTVSVGTEVVFVNDDSFVHTVTEGTGGQAADDPFVDEEVAAGDELPVTFDEAGTFEITCRIHPNMQLTVTVEG